MEAGMVTQLNNAVSWNGRRMQNPQTIREINLQGEVTSLRDDDVVGQRNGGAEDPFAHCEHFDERIGAREQGIKQWNGKPPVCIEHLGEIGEVIGNLKG
jgi:hypothetical protein